MTTRHVMGLLLLLVACGRSSTHHGAPPNHHGPGCPPPDSTVTSTATPLVVPDHARAYGVEVGHRLELVGSSTSDFEVTVSVLAVVPPGTTAAVGEGADPLSGVSTALVSTRGRGGTPLRLQFTATEPGVFPVLMLVEYRPTTDCSRSGSVGRDTAQGEAELAVVVARAAN